MLLFLHSFGNQHFAPEGEAAVVAHSQTGKATDLRIVDRVSGQEVSWPEFYLVPGPAANDAMRAKLAHTKALLEQQPKAAAE
jgi:hypothetical protein